MGAMPKMKRECAERTKGQFKLIHAFYVSMLALRYKTAKGGKVIWPNQYTWLLDQGLITWKDHAKWGMDERLIRDKINADSAVKLVAFLQVCWFVAQCIMRSAHSLPLSQLESMTLSHIPLFAAAYFFWWIKPKDIDTPSVVDLPQMSSEQTVLFQSMAVSNNFVDEGLETQVSLRNIWYLTPRVFEKEAEDKAVEEALILHKQEMERKAQLRAHQKRKQNINGDPKHVVVEEINIEDDESQGVDVSRLRREARAKVVAHWDPELYESKIWPLICLFGALFGALHLISWNTLFPTMIELWLWRAAAFVSIFSMLVFIHFEKVVFQWRGSLNFIGLISSPGLYFLSHVVMIGEVIAAPTAEDPAIYQKYVASTCWVHPL